ncbi:MAG: DUF368 domain-containing protein [Defluviitaleaceae bacterium]|nr:DUF368 domain-containing protein [Defluviitaleaceae bacterium]
MQFLFLMLTGLALGAANIVPGISGATLAVIFRVYDRLISSINSLFTQPKKSLMFLVPVGLGMVIGILVVGTVFAGLFRQFSFQTSALISGLVAGGVPFIYKQAISKDGKKPLYFVVAAVAAIIIILLALVVPTPAVGDAVFNWRFALLLFVGGLTAAAALVIPGVSGAMVMMLFGLLPIIMDTIALITDYLRTPTNLGLLGPILQVGIPLGLGIIAGILLASKLIAMLLERHFSITYFAILGMVIGTIFAVFSDPDTYYSVERMTAGIIVTGVIAFIVGMVIALFFGKRPVGEDK